VAVVDVESVVDVASVAELAAVVVAAVVAADVVVAVVVALAALVVADPVALAVADVVALGALVLVAGGSADWTADDGLTPPLPGKSHMILPVPTARHAVPGAHLKLTHRPLSHFIKSLPAHWNAPVVHTPPVGLLPAPALAGALTRSE